MRVVGWIFVLCCLTGAAGLFMPALGVDNMPGFLSKKTSISIYTASTKREVAARVFAAYHKAPGKGIGHAIAKALIPRTGKTLGGFLDDVDSAASTLDEVSDSDIGIAGKALVAIVWILLALDVVAAIAMFRIAMDEAAPRPKRILVPLALSVLIGILVTGVMLVCREAVWQANDEVGKAILTVRGGAYLMLVTAIGAVGSAIAFLVMARRGGAKAAV